MGNSPCAGVPPVIIIGMHRSGTTMLVKALKQLGFFAGAQMGVNQEAFFFQARNEWILRMAGGAWDYPLPVKALLKSEILMNEVVSKLKQGISSNEFKEFTGKGVFDSERPLMSWGWKDPRTIFLLPCWLKLFPRAKILYIIRNGVDVAQSLTVRQENDLGSGGKGPLTKQSLLWKIRNLFLPVERYVLHSARCLSIDESFKLWEEYVSEAELQYDQFQGDKMKVRYEDILGSPNKILNDIARFSGLDCTPGSIDEVAGGFNASRVYSFMSNDKLLAFYNEKKTGKLMQKLGYGSIEREE